MSCLPPTLPAALSPFAALFSRRVWAHAQVLLPGALPAPAQRTVVAALRVTGLDQTPPFHRYHSVLSHARWSGLAAGRVLLGLLVAASARAARSSSETTGRWSAAAARRSPSGQGARTGAASSGRAAARSRRAGAMDVVSLWHSQARRTLSVRERCNRRTHGVSARTARSRSARRSGSASTSIATIFPCATEKAMTASARPPAATTTPAVPLISAGRTNGANRV